MYGGGRGQAGADGGAAQVHHPQPLLALGQAPAVPVQRLGVGAHAPAQGGEHRVLAFGAGHLDHVGQGLLLVLEGLLQGQHLALQLAQAQDGGDAQGGGEGVVGALVQVEVVQGRDPGVGARGQAEQLQGAVGQHLVHVHVGGGAGAALQGVHPDLRRQGAVQQLPAGPLHGVGLGGVGEEAETAVAAQRRQLHRAEGPGQGGVHRAAQQREVVQRPGGVDAVPGRGRQGHGAQRVVLLALGRVVRFGCHGPRLLRSRLRKYTACRAGNFQNLLIKVTSGPGRPAGGAGGCLTGGAKARSIPAQGCRYRRLGMSDYRIKEHPILAAPPEPTRRLHLAGQGRCRRGRGRPSPRPCSPTASGCSATTPRTARPRASSAPTASAPSARSSPTACR